jgi:hypothetical protein
MTAPLRLTLVCLVSVGLSVGIVNCSRSGAEGSSVADATGGASSSSRTVELGGNAGSSNTAATPHDATNSCLPSGDACSNASECCTGRCDFGLCLGQTGLCSANGVHCAASAECCSGRCEASDGTNKTCVTSATQCLFGGEACNVNADCCSGVCGADGFCPVFAGCQTAGEPCTGHHECCTGVCADPGTGTAVCQYVSGCRPIGEICDVDADCCSSSCRGDTKGGVKRCDKPAGCMWPGEVCWTGQAANCCPQGKDGGNSLCLASVLGVSRCFTAGTSDACRSDGSECAFGDECCGGICLPDQTGALRCGSQCVSTGGSCTASADCCNGPCVLGRCVPNEQACIPLGQGCSTSTECCSQLCSLSGTCSIELVIQ